MIIGFTKGPGVRVRPLSRRSRERIARLRAQGYKVRLVPTLHGRWRVFKSKRRSARHRGTR